MVPYAVLPNCGASSLHTAIDNITYSASHELIESSTDPANDGSAAYQKIDADHLPGYVMMAGIEAGDMCETGFAGDVRLPSTHGDVQAIWSNTAALSGHDPCVPTLPGYAYFNGVPVLTGEVNMDLSLFGIPWLSAQKITKGIVIPVGQSKTIEVDLLSDAPTSGPWQLSAIDDTMGHGSPELSFAFDRTQGVNGEKVYVTITVLQAGPINGSAFAIVSQLGQDGRLAFGFVANQ